MNFKNIDRHTTISKLSLWVQLVIHCICYANMLRDCIIQLKILAILLAIRWVKKMLLVPETLIKSILPKIVFNYFEKKTTYLKLDMFKFYIWGYYINIDHFCPFISL